MLRIGEFVELSTISIHMLRNYDKMGILVPRYTDETSGYRYYDKEQLLQANQILALKSMGLGLEDIKIIMLQPAADVNALLQEKLKSKYEELEKTKKQIEQIKSVLHTDKLEEKYALKIVRKSMNPMWVISLTGEIDTYAQEGIMWERLGHACQQQHIMIQPGTIAMAVGRGINEETNQHIVEVQFAVDRQVKVKSPLEVKMLEAREVASIVFRGEYGQICKINSTVANWLEDNRLEINGQSFTIYHSSPGNNALEDEFITELCFPIK